MVAPYQFEPDASEDSSVDSDGSGIGLGLSLDSSEDEEARVFDLNSWCTCGNCNIMPSEDECLCCREQVRVREKAEEGNALCLTQHPDLDHLCLNFNALKTALRLYAKKEIRRLGGLNLDANAKYRYTAYRQFVGFVYPNAGRARIVLPACAVLKIRERYPSADGTYTGFLYA